MKHAPAGECRIFFHLVAVTFATTSKIIDLRSATGQALVLHMCVLIKNNSSRITPRSPGVPGEVTRVVLGRAWRMGGSLWVLGTVVLVTFCAAGLAGFLLAALLRMASDEPSPGLPD